MAAAHQNDTERKRFARVGAIRRSASGQQITHALLEPGAVVGGIKISELVGRLDGWRLCNYQYRETVLQELQGQPRNLVPVGRDWFGVAQHHEFGGMVT